jgi:hypothetical protein
VVPITCRVIVTDIPFPIIHDGVHLNCRTTANILGVLPYHLSKVATSAIWRCGTSWRFTQRASSGILIIMVPLLLTDKRFNCVDSRHPTSGPRDVHIFTDHFTRSEGIILSVCLGGGDPTSLH